MFHSQIWPSFLLLWQIILKVSAFWNLIFYLTAKNDTLRQNWCSWNETDWLELWSGGPLLANIGQIKAHINRYIIGLCQQYFFTVWVLPFQSSQIAIFFFLVMKSRPHIYTTIPQKIISFIHLNCVLQKTAQHFLFKKIYEHILKSLKAVSLKEGELPTRPWTIKLSIATHFWVMTRQLRNITCYLPSATKTLAQLSHCYS